MIPVVSMSNLVPDRPSRSKEKRRVISSPVDGYGPRVHTLLWKPKVVQELSQSLEVFLFTVTSLSVTDGGRVGKGRKLGTRTLFRKRP